MYKKITTVDLLLKDYTLEKYISEDGSYIIQWEEDKYFNDMYEINGYKVYISKTYNYFNNKRGIVNISNGKTYIILIKINDKSKIENNYEIISNQTDNYIFHYRMGLLSEVICLNEKSGFVRYSKYMDDYSYNSITLDRFSLNKEKIIVIYYDIEYRISYRNDKIKIYNYNDNLSIINYKNSVYDMFNNYPKFNNFRDYLVGLIL